MTVRESSDLRAVLPAPELAPTWRVELADEGDRLVCFSRVSDSDQVTARRRAEELAKVVTASGLDDIQATRAWAASYLGPRGQWRGVLEIMFEHIPTGANPVPA